MCFKTPVAIAVCHGFHSQDKPIRHQIPSSSTGSGPHVFALFCSIPPATLIHRLGKAFSEPTCPRKPFQEASKKAWRPTFGAKAASQSLPPGLFFGPAIWISYFLQNYTAPQRQPRSGLGSAPHNIMFSVLTIHPKSICFTGAIAASLWISSTGLQQRHQREPRNGLRRDPAISSCRC